MPVTVHAAGGKNCAPITTPTRGQIAYRHPAQQATQSHPFCCVGVARTSQCVPRSQATYAGPYRRRNPRIPGVVWLSEPRAHVMLLGKLATSRIAKLSGVASLEAFT